MSDSGARIARLLAEHPIIDGHNDLPWAMREAGIEPEAPGLAGELPQFRTDFDRLRRGGVGGQWWSVYVPSTLGDDEALRTTIEQVHLVRRMVTAHSDHLELALDADDVVRAVSAGKLACLIGAEGGHSIGGTLSGLWALHALGVRYLTLTHNDNTVWADSATDRRVVGGLSSFGREVVRAMNAIGVIVDLSHVSAETMNAALDITTRPVLFSHSGARALVDHPRNVPSDVLARLAVNGGVCMVAFVPHFLSLAYRDWDDGGRHGPRPLVTVVDVADHIEHVREVAGIDHVGLGGDYDGCPDFPVGLEDVSTYPRLLSELADRHWSDAELAKLTTRNALRVLADNGRTDDK